MSSTQLSPAVGNENLDTNVNRTFDRTSRTDNISDLASPMTIKEQDDHEMLVQAGLVSPESISTESAKLHEFTSDEEKWKHPDMDGNDSLSKVRHSLHRKLQNAHVPNHHRSRKGKDSSSVAGTTEEASSIAENEGLARGTGSFVVHGKKASVIKFGSEWQNMSPEERLKLRKSAQVDASKLSIPPSVEDDAVSETSEVYADARPISAASDSTTTATSFQPPLSGKSQPRDSFVSAVSSPSGTRQENDLSTLP